MCKDMKRAPKIFNYHLKDLKLMTHRHIIAHTRLAGPALAAQNSLNHPIAPIEVSIDRSPGRRCTEGLGYE